MHIIGCAALGLILVFILILLAPMILLNLIRSLFGFKTKNQWGASSNKSHEKQGNEYTSSTQQKRKDNKKIFERNEGEYVDFEEIKD
jgi:Sec-independent protein translocase protein TatA